MVFLDKTIADTLCTAITLGCFKLDGSKFNVQYQDMKDKPDHDLVGKLFTRLGVAFTATQSPSQKDMPYILAKTPKIPNFSYAKALTVDYLKYLRVITASVNKLPEAPRGAYIGGMSTINKLNIVGPSALHIYPAKFRQVTDTSVEDAYVKSAIATNDSLACLKKDTPAATPAGIKLEFSDLGQPIELKKDKDGKPVANLGPGEIFGSYHGMILAMTKYQTTIDNNSFFFEIALGSNTSKVSSCFPCSLLMLASNTPATSTHLGRGDNWKIPDGSLAEKAWRDKINAYYQKGKEILAGKPVYSPALAAIDKNANGQIAEAFLEALTFESSFIDKIKTTLNLG